MDLFEYAKSKTLDRESPLASRLRPTSLEEVVGQEHIVGKDKLLYRAIKADKLTSVIFYGPPGTGKTTLAKVIANTTSANFTQINATVAGKKDMEAVVKEAQDNLGMYGKKTILFIDEIHRFNKGQQDYLLPFVEDGTLTLDEKVLDGASVQDLKTAFYKDNDLEEIAQKSIRVQANAISGKYAATVSNYTDSGTYSNSALSSFLKSI